METQPVTEHTGFPNPATDTTLTSLTISDILVKHPASTFFMEIADNDWQPYGIFSGDIIVIDRSLSAQDHDLVIWWSDTSFTISRTTKLPLDALVWGVVTSTIHRYRS